MRQYGKILPPYAGVTRCAAVECQAPELSEDESGAYLFTDVETDKFRVFCGTCAAYVELHRAERFKLVML